MTFAGIHMRSMQKRLLCLLIFLSATRLFAQQPEGKNNGGVISGKVLDSSNNRPVEYAAISLFSDGTKKPINGAVTDSTGHFRLNDIDPGSYRILVECIGYKPVTRINILISKKNDLISLASFKLVSNAVTMQTVTVTSSTPLVENKIDKIVFNAEIDLTSQGGVATDVLKKVPQVSVDVDGNVELAGSSGIRFLINGKPSTAFGSNITDVLQSIPASQIKRIEVITNPGARYDAQGLGGIINIILRQTKVKGINGNLSLTAGTLNQNGSFNFNARKGDFGFNAFASGNARLTTTVPVHSERLTEDTAGKKNTSLVQDASTRFDRHGIESGVGFDWTYKKKNNFTGSFRYANFGNNSVGITNQLQNTTDQVSGALLSSISTINHTDNVFHMHNTDLNLNYKRTFNREDQELEIGLNSSYQKYTSPASNYQLLQPQDSLYYGTNGFNPGNQKQLEFQADYTQPLKKDIIFGTGGKISYNNIGGTSTILSYQPDSKIYSYDTSLSNFFNYRQYVFAYYGEITLPIGSLFNIKAGSRFERTEIDPFFSHAQQQAGKHGYNTIVPSVFFSKKLGDDKVIKLSYSKRIERPDYQALNPFINTTDPKNISTGNPLLNPEIGHRMELSYNKSYDKKGSFMVTAFYRINVGDIQPFIVYYPSLRVGDSLYTNVAVTTRRNIGQEKNMGMNIFVDLHLHDKLNVRTNMTFFRRHTVNVIDPGFNYTSFNYRLNLNLSYQFTQFFAAEFFGSFNSPRHEAQGKYPSFTTYSLALRKHFKNKKGSLALSATNPFALYVDQRTELSGPEFAVNSLRRVPFRSIGLNFTWKFGKLEFKKEKEENKEPAAVTE
jgi:ferric enterobactin receptor